MTTGRPRTAGAPFEASSDGAGVVEIAEAITVADGVAPRGVEATAGASASGFGRYTSSFCRSSAPYGISALRSNGPKLAGALAMPNVMAEHAESTPAVAAIATRVASRGRFSISGRL